MQGPASESRRICIVGAGVTGLVAAYALAKEGFRVTVLESELRAGGILSSFRIGWEDLERVPHLLDADDRVLLDLFRGLGLESHIEWYRPTAALYLEGLHQPLMRPTDLLRLHPLPFLKRLRAVMASWARAFPLHRARRSVICDDILHPLLTRRAAADPEGLPVEWFMFPARRTVWFPRPGKTSGYPAGGFSILVRALLKEFESFGGTLHYGCTATDVTAQENGFRVDCVLEDCSSSFSEADAVIATVSERRFAEMTTGLALDSRYMDRLRSARYLGHLCLVLRLKQSLSSFHRTLVSTDLPFRLVTEHTGLVGLRRYGGHIVYLSRELDTSDPLWTQPDGDLFRLFFRGLTEMHPELVRSDVKDWRLTRTRYAYPGSPAQADSGIVPMSTPLPGLFLAGIAQACPGGRSLDRSVETGLAAAAMASRALSVRKAGAGAIPGIMISEVV